MVRFGFSWVWRSEIWDRLRDGERGLTWDMPAVFFWQRVKESIRDRR